MDEFESFETVSDYPYFKKYFSDVDNLFMYNSGFSGYVSHSLYYYIF